MIRLLEAHDMMRISNTLLGLSLCLALGACQQSTTAPIQPAPSTTPGASPSNNASQNANGVTSPVDGNGLATIPITLDAQELRSKYTLDLNKLSYNFAYLSTTRGDAIKFQNDKATLIFSGLTSGKRGDLKLEILEAGVVKLRAVSPGLVLTPGNMHISLVLKPVDSSQGGDLTLNITIANDAQPGTGTDTASHVSGSGNVAGTGGSSANTGGSSSSSRPVNTGGSSSNGPSFAHDVKPILDAHCAECHTPHGQSPDFSQAPAASIIDTMLSVVQTGQMPPKPRDQLTSAEVAKIKAWKDSGLHP